MQRFSAPVTFRPSLRPPRPLIVRLVLITALAVVAAGCSSGQGSDGDISTDGQSTDGQVTVDDSADAANGDQNDGGSDGDGQAGSGDSDSSGEPSDSQNTAGGQSFPGQCGIDEVNRQSFYSVANIEADDPDGGLNLRDDYENGDKILTLPEGSVVLAEDCFKRDDGAVWYAVQTTDNEVGWVNAAFLSAEVSALEPTFGGTETADKVTRLLDALAARRWEDAAAELALPDAVAPPVVSLLGEPGREEGSAQESGDDEAAAEEQGPDLAGLLAAYCNIRVCDGPYTITDIRGSYVPARISPEVDVTFTYSGGIVTQTFRQVYFDEETFSLDTLPGQSILAFKRNPPSVSNLVTATNGLPAGLLEAAETVRRSLLSETGDPVPDGHMPSEGVVVSTSAFIDPPESRQVVTAQDLALNGDVERIWGYADGVGSPIVATVDEQMATFRRQAALLEPDVASVDTRVGLSNTIDNLSQSFPDAHIVEFHREGRGELMDFNWSSVRLALELRDRQWVLVAITTDNWTV